MLSRLLGKAKAGPEPEPQPSGQPGDNGFCVRIQLPNGLERELRLLREVSDALGSLAYRLEREYCPGTGPFECQRMPDTIAALAEKLKALEGEAESLLDKRLRDLEERLPGLLEAALLNAVAERIGSKRRRIIII